MADCVTAVAESVEVTKAACVDKPKDPVAAVTENGHHDNNVVVNGNCSGVENSSADDATINALKRKAEVELVEESPNTVEQAKKPKSDDTQEPTVTDAPAVTDTPAGDVTPTDADTPAVTVTPASGDSVTAVEKPSAAETEPGVETVKEAKAAGDNAAEVAVPAETNATA